MANVPVEIRWSDEDERLKALEALNDVNGQEVQVFDGLIEAAVPPDVVDVLIARNLACSFPKGLEQTAAGLAADSGEVFVQRVPFNALPSDQKSILIDFSNRSRMVEMQEVVEPGTGAGTGRKKFAVRSLERLDDEPTVDGLGLEGLKGADEKHLPDPDKRLPVDAYIVRLKGPLRPKWRKELEAVAPLGDHRPPDTFRMVLTPEQLTKVEGLTNCVRAVKRYGLLDTLTPAMLKLLDQQQQGKASGNKLFDLTVHRPQDLSAVAQLLRDTDGVHIVDQEAASLRFEAPVESDILAAITNLPLVRTLAPYDPPKLFLDQARPLVGVDAFSPAAQGAPDGKWTGEGETVAVFDSGVDAAHPDLAPALAPAPAQFGAGQAADINGHGTHVAGIVAGRGRGSNPRIRGIAPGANVFSVGMVRPDGVPDIPLDLGRLLSLATAAGAKIVNLSWGMKLHTDYDVYGASIDRFVRDNPEVLVVVAAGNEGSVPLNGASRGRHNPSTVGMPAAAKNVLTVGACCNRRPGYTTTWGQLKPSVFPDPPAAAELVAAPMDFPAALSSRGPTGFNMIKPDVLAPGTMILSARAGNATIGFIAFGTPPAEYGYLNGTSMATPVVAGMAAMLRQYLRLARQKADPSAALLKALIILSARRIEGANRNSILRDIDPQHVIGFPDFDQGFGVVDLRNLLPPDQRRLIFADVANKDAGALQARQDPGGGQHRSFRPYRVQVPNDSNVPLRVALVWTDAPGRFLQNGMSVQVRTPDDTILTGNHEHRAYADLVMLATNAPLVDKYNNAQLVVIPNPKKGSYRITVTAEATTDGPQGYALAVSGPVAEDTLTPLF
jgi:subtilisin family serine protease